MNAAPAIIILRLGKNGPPRYVMHWSSSVLPKVVSASFPMTERPADRGTTEAAWAKNRRTVIRVDPS